MMDEQQLEEALDQLLGEQTCTERGR